MPAHTASCCLESTDDSVALYGHAWGQLRTSQGGNCASIVRAYIRFMKTCMMHTGNDLLRYFTAGTAITLSFNFRFPVLVLCASPTCSTPREDIVDRSKGLLMAASRG